MARKSSKHATYKPTAESNYRVQYWTMNGAHNTAYYVYYEDARQDYIHQCLDCVLECGKCTRKTTLQAKNKAGEWSTIFQSEVLHPANL